MIRKESTAVSSFPGIVGRNPSIVEILETVSEVAGVNVPVLIQGESGTGKELIANAIHSLSRRSEGPFIPVNCAALPDSLLESELFGHVKGAFTGATREKKGRFELAHGGTIFLDEVADLSPPIQASLLRVLQDGTFERVGGEKRTKVNVRLISATNNFLEKLVARRKFREDLYYRLCVVPITVPPLRERRDDLPLLAEYLADKLSGELGRTEKVVVSQEALDLLMGHSWPGNIRELRNAIHYALVKSRDAVLKTNHFPPSLSLSTLMKRGRKRKLTTAAVERALSETNGNKMAAARKLGVCRATLYKHLEREH